MKLELNLQNSDITYETDFRALNKQFFLCSILYTNYHRAEAQIFHYFPLTPGNVIIT